MGGQGSGNRYHWRRGTKKTTVERCHVLDIGLCTRERILNGGVCHTGDWEWKRLGQTTLHVQYEIDTTDETNMCLRLRYSWVRTATQQADSADYCVRLT